MCEVPIHTVAEPGAICISCQGISKLAHREVRWRDPTPQHDDRDAIGCRRTQRTVFLQKHTQAGLLAPNVTLSDHRPQSGAPARKDPAGGDIGWMGREAERGGCAAVLCAASARARPLLWLRLTPHRMSQSRVLLSTAISSLSQCLPMGSRLSLTEPCAEHPLALSDQHSPLCAAPISAVRPVVRVCACGY